LLPHFECRGCTSENHSKESKLSEESEKLSVAINSETGLGIFSSVLRTNIPYLEPVVTSDFPASKNDACLLVSLQ